MVSGTLARPFGKANTSAAALSTSALKNKDERQLRLIRIYVYRLVIRNGDGVSLLCVPFAMML